MALKVLHMHFGKEGGAERFFVGLCQAFAEAGLEQRFVTRPNRLWADDIAALGPVIHSHYRRIAPSSVWLTWRVHAMVRSWKPDAIMAWMSRSSRLMPNYPDAVKLTRLGDYPRHIKHFRYNDLIVPNTPDIGRWCQEMGWSGRVEVISNFAREVAAMPVDRSDLDTPADAFVIAGSGRFIRRKGFDTLVAAAAQRPGAWLWLIGAGDKQEDLEAQVRAAGMADRTRFVGWVEEPMRYVAAADVFVMPSRHEPLGNVVLEAWAAGVPCITTASEGPSWFATHEQDCLIVPIDGIDEMAAALARIETEPDLSAHLVAMGRDTLAKRFSKDAVVAEYMRIFRGTAE
ncbi:MAG: glycosyltransferase [Pseudomonadota bacterium]